MQRDELFKILEELPYQTLLIFEFKSGVVFKAEFDTAYETNNGLEEDEPGYKEYYACLFRVLKILKGTELLEGAESKLIEISILNPPSKVYYENGEVIWPEEKKDNKS